MSLHDEASAAADKVYPVVQEDDSVYFTWRQIRNFQRSAFVGGYLAAPATLQSDDWEYGYLPRYANSHPTKAGQPYSDVRPTSRTPENWLPDMSKAYRRRPSVTIPAGEWGLVPTERQPLSDVEMRVWEVMEPYMEDFINLDLNSPEDSKTFRSFVLEVAKSISKENPNAGS